MKRTSIVAAVTALALSLGNVAFARDNERDHDDRQRSDKGHADRGHYDRGRHGGAGPQYHANPPYRAVRQAPPRFRDGPPDRHAGDRRGAGPDHNWYRGSRLPPAYRSRQYVVEDWRGHRLSAPPRGYYWVQNGSDYLLVAIATGVIATILLNN